MAVPINGLTVFLAQTSAGVSAASALTDPKNLTATVIGVGQAAQSVVSIASTDIPRASIPSLGAALSAAGAAYSISNILNSYNASGSVSSVNLADISSLVANMAGTVATLGAGEAAISAVLGFAVIPAAIASTPVVVGLTLVGIGAGAFALVASSKGWKVDDLGNWVAASLNSEEIAQADSMVKSISSDPQRIAHILSDLGLTATSVGKWNIEHGLSPSGLKVGSIEIVDIGILGKVTVSASRDTSTDQITETIIKNGIFSEYYYDVLGACLREDVHFGDRNSSVSFSRQFDNGRLIESYYDIDGHEISSYVHQSTSLNSPLVWVWEKAEGKVSEYVYDSNGNWVGTYLHQTDSLSSQLISGCEKVDGRMHEYCYDTSGNWSATFIHQTDSFASPLVSGCERVDGKMNEYNYDGNGNWKATYIHQSDSLNSHLIWGCEKSGGKMNEYLYDATGHWSGTFVHQGESLSSPLVWGCQKSDGRINEYKYDAEGHWSGTFIHQTDLLSSPLTWGCEKIDGRMSEYIYDSTGHYIGSNVHQNESLASPLTYSQVIENGKFLEKTYDSSGSVATTAWHASADPNSFVTTKYWTENGHFRTWWTDGAGHYADSMYNGTDPFSGLAKQNFVDQTGHLHVQNFHDPRSPTQPTDYVYKGGTVDSGLAYIGLQVKPGLIAYFTPIGFSGGAPFYASNGNLSDSLPHWVSVPNGGTPSQPYTYRPSGEVTYYFPAEGDLPAGRTVIGELYVEEFHYLN
ncbi:hypothetical protein [Cupriavidus numazuensis]|uniref:Uncharacterized protein n=1 Tax=Cupriavidus numazuensis TaxID=221992 RepID=A0ABM8TQW0_9BURK|nr:hypothetical protein [Cupriavidus numazuensis]CAG2158488.1 hypothetical protein LMG26411_06011 [Cupriavidus numazuensis]